MSVRNRSDDLFPLRSPAVQPGHRRGDEGFVNEDPLSRIQRHLVGVPQVTGEADVFPVLFGGPERFF